MQVFLWSFDNRKCLTQIVDNKIFVHNFSNFEWVFSNCSYVLESFESQLWFKNGVLHRTDGPAVVPLFEELEYEYWVEGKKSG